MKTNFKVTESEQKNKTNDIFPENIFFRNFL